MKCLTCIVAVVLVSALGLACNKTDSAKGKSETGGKSDAAAGSRLDQEAKAAALAEIGRHWVQHADGWITSREVGSAYAPEHYLRQVREITITGVGGDDLSASDKLNGFEWSGAVNFQPSPCREFGDPGVVLEGMANATVMRPRGQWSQWVDFAPEQVRLQKVKGQWQIPQDTWMLRGKLPTSAELSKAAVK